MHLFNFITWLAFLSIASFPGNNLFGVQAQNYYSVSPQDNHYGNGNGPDEGGQFTTTAPGTGVHTASPQTCATTSSPVHLQPTKPFNENATNSTSVAPHKSPSAKKYPPLNYKLIKSYSPGSFFDQFHFYTGPDPTHGFVEYASIKFSPFDG